MDGQTISNVPQKLSQLRIAILAQEASLPKRLQQIARFALNNPEQIALSTLSELSAAAEAPPSAFVRFAKSFGFNGFKEMQDVFQLSVKNKWLSYDRRLVSIAPHDESDVFEATVSAAINALISLRDNVDLKALNKAVETICNADTIYICAAGRSESIAIYMQYMMTRLKKRNHLISVARDDARAEFELVTPQDAILAISFMPYREVSKRAVQFANEHNIPLVTITDTLASPLNVGQALFVNEQDVGGFRTVSTATILAQYLAVETGRRLANQKEEL